MEDLEAALALNFSVSSEINSPSSIHPRFNNYKNKGKLSDNQEERRNRVIESSKSRREELVNQIRRITSDEQMTIGRKKRSRKIADQLMFSEWMVEVPIDLEKNYSFVLCHVGKRCLVVAANGSTICYDKFGSVLAEFPSALHGGNRDTPQKSTVLDCILDKSSKTYYVIDMISHDNQYLYQSETEYRWYWLECKFREDMEEVHVRSKKNPYVFMLAPRFKCTKELFREVFSKESEFEIDGLLFYNKEHPYVFGFSPVTTWLKPYMLPEMFGVEVHEFYLKQIPSWYSGFPKHLEDVKRRVGEREQKKIEKEQKIIKTLMENESLET